MSWSCLQDSAISVCPIPDIASPRSWHI
jgi:hypothetical protein